MNPYERLALADEWLFNASRHLRFAALAIAVQHLSWAENEQACANDCLLEAEKWLNHKEEA